MTKLKKLLKGKSPEAIAALDNLWQNMSLNPTIAWYPSAGLDFRDLLELNPIPNQTSKPELFIHTDYQPYCPNINERFTGFEPGIIVDRYEPDYHKEILEVHQLMFTNSIKYYIDENFVDFVDEAPIESKVFLLSVKVRHKDDILIRPVIYFVFENINFLDEIILKHNIKISHLIKVREGCGLGGNRKSITIAYAFAAKLGLQYLICDNEAEPDIELINKLTEKHALINYRFNLEKIGTISEWSGLFVKIFRLDYFMELDWVLDDIRAN
jgi:hypothetical protein